MVAGVAVCPDGVAAGDVLADGVHARIVRARRKGADKSNWNGLTDHMLMYANHMAPRSGMSNRMFSVCSPIGNVIFGFEVHRMQDGRIEVLTYRPHRGDKS